MMSGKYYYTDKHLNDLLAKVLCGLGSILLTVIYYQSMDK